MPAGEVVELRNLMEALLLIHRRHRELGGVDDIGLPVASLLDIAAQKVRVVQVRAERKDYLDLVTLFEHGVRLPQALGAAKAIYRRAMLQYLQASDSYRQIIETVVLDTHASIVDGSIGAIPRRVMVDDDAHAQATMILREAGEL